MNELSAEIIKLSKVPSCQQKKIRTDYFADITKDCTPAKGRRKMLIVAGLPGTGKTTYISKTKKQHLNSAVLGVDDFYHLHPNLFKLHELQPMKLNSKSPDCFDNEILDSFATQSFNETLAETLSRGYNVIIDLPPTDDIFEFTEIAQDLGYQIDMRFLVIPKRELETNMLYRYEQGMDNFLQAKQGLRPQNGFNVPHLLAQMRVASGSVADIAQVLKRVEHDGFNLEIINPREDTVLYDNKNTQGGATQAFEKELYRNLTPQELQRQSLQQSKIRSLMEKRHATPYEYSVLQNTKLPMPKFSNTLSMAHQGTRSY